MREEKEINCPKYLKHMQRIKKTRSDVIHKIFSQKKSTRSFNHQFYRKYLLIKFEIINKFDQNMRKSKVCLA